MKKIQTKNLVDFGLFTYAKDYYSAAQILKENGSKNPYYIMLALSIECFLKSIQSSTQWYGLHATTVEHIKGHNLAEIFNEIEINHPSDAEYLKSEYKIQYSRSLKQDIELNKTVFMDKRYPYSFKGDIPKLSLPTDEEVIHGTTTISYKNNIAVYISQLEDVAKFLFDVLSKHID